MGLPAELIPYAENLYRRFPEEFIALGMPGLEAVYDLRPSGTWSRRMFETPSEKTVEITMRRWSAMPMTGIMPLQCLTPSPLASWCHPQQMVAAAAAVQQQQQQQHYQQQYQQQLLQQQQSAVMPPPKPMATAEDHEATQRLARLEAALSALKPQIETILAVQAPMAQFSEPPQKAHYAMQPTGAPAQSSASSRQPCGQHGDSAAAAAATTATSTTMTAATASPTVAAAAAAAAAAGTASGTTPAQATDAMGRLTARRNMGHLQIQTAPKEKPLEQPIAFIPAAAANNKQEGGGDSEGHSSADDVPAARPKQNAADEGKVGQRRPCVNINAVRVAPSVLDPASPRSPGRFSAWK
jgi:hypothetical protein